MMEKRAYKLNAGAFNGIDRKDNNRGYCTDNVVPCCKACNRAKMSTPYDKFMLYLNRIANFRIQHSLVGESYVMG